MNNRRRKRLKKLLKIYEGLLSSNSIVDIKQILEKTYDELFDVKFEEEINFENRTEGSQCSASGEHSEMCIENMEEVLSIIDDIKKINSFKELEENEYLENIIDYIDECI